MLTGVLVNSDNKVIAKVNGTTTTVISEEFKTLPVDSEITSGTDHLVTSQGIKDYMDEHGVALTDYTKTVSVTEDGKTLKFKNVEGGSTKDEVSWTPTTGDANLVNDVKVNGISVVADKIANITITPVPTNVSAFNNDASYATTTQVNTAKSDAISTAAADATTKADAAKAAAIADAATKYQEIGDYALKSELPTVPSKVSAFTNDAGYITKAVDDLTNYSTTTKMNTTIATEIGKMTHIEFKVVDSLVEVTETNKIYLVKQPEGSKVKYKEYIKLTSGTIEEIGDTDIDLSGKQDTIIDLATIRSGAAAGATAVQPSAITDMETKTNAAATYQIKGDYALKSEIPDVSAKQDKLVPGTGITIAADGKTISASGTTLSDYVKSTIYSSTDKKLTITSVVSGTEQTPVEVAIGGGDGKVKDVKVNGTTALDSEGVANITVPSVEGFITKDVNDLTNYETATVAQGKYLTEHQSLADYALKSEVPSIPTNVSAFTNDAGYLTAHQDISGKQDKLKAGTNITISDDNTISATGGDGKVKDIKIATTSILDEATGVATIAIEGTYDGTDNKIITTEALGTVADAKQDEITTEHKLDYSLIDNTPTIPTVPTTVSSFTNDAGYLTTHQSLAGLATETYVGNSITTATSTLATKTDLDSYVTKDGAKVLTDINYSESDKAIVDSAITETDYTGEKIKAMLDGIAYYPSAVDDFKLADNMEPGTSEEPNKGLPNVTQVREFVNSSINSVSAYYITADATGNAFASKSALTSATVFYYDGKERTPTKNDYTLVLSDESKNYASTRYVYTGSQWSLQYVVNNAPFTTAQAAAINSGATSDIITNAAKLSAGTAGQFLKSTGTSVEWANHPVMKFNGSDVISSINFTVDETTKKLTITIE